MELFLFYVNMRFDDIQIYEGNKLKTQKKDFLQIPRKMIRNQLFFSPAGIYLTELKREDLND